MNLHFLNQLNKFFMKNIILFLFSIMIFSLLSCNNKQVSKPLDFGFSYLQTEYSPKSLSVSENSESLDIEFPYEYSVFEFNKPTANIDVKVNVIDTFENYISWNIENNYYSYDKPFKFSPSRNCVFEWYNKNSICFSSSCGTDCFYTWILSCENNITSVNYYYNEILKDSLAFANKKTLNKK